LVREPIPETAHCEPEVAPAKTQAVLQAIGSYPDTQTGIWGAPEQANVAKGRALIEKLVRNMHEQVAKLLELVNDYHV